ncbi:MAG: phosphate starvation-inducible protein PhoH [Planctomycetota bacterium]|nr:MAG: phosphate starvation-inducible protein PhoH [Planctomycetota bacterium]HIC22219.1 PhoH family protein [Planctomycetota bacterium]
MKVTIEFQDDDEAQVVLGIRDAHLRRIRTGFAIEAAARGRVLDLQGSELGVSAAQQVVERMLGAHRLPGSTTVEDELNDALVRFQQPEESDPVDHGNPSSQNLFEDEDRPRRRDFGKIARTEGQLRYLEAMDSHDIVMALGPAGTGKTYLAVRTALQALKTGEVRKLILSRPAVEAGEKLGFLPGDFQQKVNPYLRPLYDALHEMLDYDQVKRYSDREIIEIVPLAYMRGRTLNQAFIILDEAQNTTPAQMKMFLTRMGTGSRIVVTGDPTQLDLPRGQPSGLLHAREVLGSVKGMAWIELGSSDIVRNRLVTRIVDAYESLDRDS